MASIGTIVPSAAVMFIAKRPAFIEHSAEPVTCTTKVVVMKPPLVEVVWALLGSRVDDSWLVAAGDDVLTGSGAGAAHAAVISIRTPTKARTFRMLLTPPAA